MDKCRQCGLCHICDLDFRFDFCDKLWYSNVVKEELGVYSVSLFFEGVRRVEDLPLFCLFQ